MANDSGAPFASMDVNLLDYLGLPVCSFIGMSSDLRGPESALRMAFGPCVG